MTQRDKDELQRAIEGGDVNAIFAVTGRFVEDAYNQGFEDGREEGYDSGYYDGRSEDNNG